MSCTITKRGSIATITYLVAAGGAGYLTHSFLKMKKIQPTSFTGTTSRIIADVVLLPMAWMVGEDFLPLGQGYPIQRCFVFGGVAKWTLYGGASLLALPDPYRLATAEITRHLVGFFYTAHLFNLINLINEYKHAENSNKNLTQDQQNLIGKYNCFVSKTAALIHALFWGALPLIPLAFGPRVDKNAIGLFVPLSLWMLKRQRDKNVDKNASQRANMGAASAIAAGVSMWCLTDWLNLEGPLQRFPIAITGFAALTAWMKFGFD